MLVPWSPRRKRGGRWPGKAGSDVSADDDAHSRRRRGASHPANQALWGQRGGPPGCLRGWRWLHARAGDPVGDKQSERETARRETISLQQHESKIKGLRIKLKRAVRLTRNCKTSFLVSRPHRVLESKTWVASGRCGGLVPVNLSIPAGVGGRKSTSQR